MTLTQSTDHAASPAQPVPVRAASPLDSVLKSPARLQRLVRGIVADDRRLKKIPDTLNRLLQRAEDAGLMSPVHGFSQQWREEYPELIVLEQQHATIRAECEQLLQDRSRLPDIQALAGAYTRGGIHSARWKSFLFKSGSFVEENCQLAPLTAGLLRGIPGLYTAFFSILEPGQRITPHWGYWKGFARFHLGVIIPDDNREQKCWLRINSDPVANARRDKSAIEQGEKYYWRNGEGILFDDTFLHDAMNGSDETRVVLWLDLARKMSEPLHTLNQLFLGAAHALPAVAAVRRNAVVQRDARPAVKPD